MEKTLKFKTNINCSGCLATVSKVLNQKESISNWIVDLNNSDKTLSVTTEELSAKELILKIKSVGFNAQEV